MTRMVETVKDALVELENNGACRFHAGFVTASEWKNSYLPALREQFPDCWYTVNSNNHIVVRAH